ncbi:MAG: N-6 DNA methylase [Janthinobacterium lividum]
MQTLRYYKPFVKSIEQLGRRHGVERVFGDFLTLATCALHPQTLAHPGHDHDPANEAEYLAVSKSYERPELDGIAELLGLVLVQAREQPFTDLLGEFFTEHVTRGHNGQFFTPDSICSLMARLTAGDEPPTGKTVYDPACGSGRMVLGFAEDAPRNTFFAGDVDVRCARMTAINFFANKLTGEVAHMNALSLECWRGWHVNGSRGGIQPVASAQVVQAGRPRQHEALPPPRPQPAPPPPSLLAAPVRPATAPGAQLGLF